MHALTPTTQERILEAALAAFARLGQRKLTMSDVVEEAGIARGTLYRYFPNKQALLDAVATYVRDGGRANLRAAVAARPDPAERFEVIASIVLRTDWMHPESLRVLEVEPAFALSFLRETFPDWVDEVSRLMEDARDHLPGVRQGKISVRDLAETLLRISASQWIIPPRDEPRTVAAIAAIVTR